jgi:type II secretory pathway predicted ATPase ExeA
MFKQFFSLKYNPFDKSIPTTALFDSNDTTELTGRLKYLLETRGIGLVIGEPGSGKSTTIRKFAGGLNPSSYRPCYISLTTLTVMDFYKSLAISLGETPEYKKISLFHQIQEAINTSYYERKVTPVLILDEFHLASNSILEDISLIFNFDFDSKTPYVLILMGQTSLRNKLQLNIHLSLRQRISIKHSMSGMTEEETAGYLDSLLKSAGASESLFNQTASRQIHASTNGFPRPVNNLATLCLMIAAAKRLHQVDEEVVFQAQKEL